MLPLKTIKIYIIGITVQRIFLLTTFYKLTILLRKLEINFYGKVIPFDFYLLLRIY
jgi:hypothetical protein